MTRLASGRVVGALFLMAFLCYGLGGLLVASVTGADDVLGAVGENASRIRVGGLLMLANSVVVVAIGVLVHDVLRPHDRRVAVAYLLARGFEATVLSMGVIALLLLVPLADGSGLRPRSPSASGAGLTDTLVGANDVAFHVAMLGLAFGSVLFCAVLIRHALVPRWLAWWGLLGYAVFGLGAVFEVLGLPVGVVLAMPGGLFEVALGVVLLRRGFATTWAADDDHQVALSV